jgi:hypothetical protein
MNKKFVLAGLAALAATGGYMLLPKDRSMNLRKQLIAVALDEMAMPNAAKYWEEGGPRPPEWCGYFILWCLHRVGLAKNLRWKIGIGFLSNLPQTTLPVMGDIAYFKTNQHHAIVKEVNADGTITLINGNAPGISISTVPRARIAAFYSIQPLINQVI